MKKLICSAALLAGMMAFSQLAHAQKVPDKTQEGYVIDTRKKDTLRGFITIYNKLGRQEKAVFYKDMSNVRTKGVYDATRAKGYYTDSTFYEAIAYPKEDEALPQSFAQLVKKGKLSLYYWYAINPKAEKKNPRPPEAHYDDNELERSILVKKGNGKVENLNTFKFINFKKAMSEYLREDKELAQKIADKKLTIDNIEQIVDEYNSWAEHKKR